MMQENSNDITGAMYAQEMIELFARLTKKLNAGNAQTYIDPRFQYCHKTGQVCGKRDLEAIEDALKVHGTDYVEYLLKVTPGIHCHPNWIRTDSDTLDRLMRHDPRGYAVYALKLLTDRFYQPPHIPKRDIGFARIEQTWSLARAWQILGALDQIQLATLNDNLCGVLTFTNPHVPSGHDVFMYIQRHAKQHVTKPEDFAILAKSGLLTDILQASTDAAINSIAEHNRAAMRNNASKKADKFLEIPKTPAQIASRAPSQIRGQKRAHIAVFDAEMLLEFGSLFDDVKNPAPGKEKWRALRLQGQEEYESIAVDEFADMAFDLDSDTRKHSDTPQVRRMSPLLLQTRATFQNTTRIVTGERQKPLDPKQWEHEQFKALPVTQLANRIAKIQAKSKPNQTVLNQTKSTSLADGMAKPKLTLKLNIKKD